MKKMVRGRQRKKSYISTHRRNFRRWFSRSRGGRRRAVVTVTVGVLLLVGSVQHPLSAQPLDTEITDTMAQSGWTAAQRGRVTAILERAADHSLPTGSIESRLLQGLARNVRPARVLAVLDEQLRDLLEARRILTEVPGATAIAENTASLERTAVLLRGGYTAEEITAVVRASVPRPEDYRAATSLYAAVVDWGADTADALTLVHAAIASVVAGDDFPRIAALLGVIDPRRYTLDDAVEMIAESLREGRSVREITRRLSR